ncbi:MAG: hypothetical protein L0241_07365, partial [Planctomycetia bacterium]|nr:hypothetical protein [Planctomycetia bacterium]
EAALAFLKAVKAKDVDAVMKVSAAPFVRYAEGAVEVLKDEAALKAWVKEKIGEIKNTDKIPTTIDKITPFAEIKDKIKDANDRKKIEEVVGKDGFVAFITSGDEKMIPILVRVKDGQAKIVGLAR